MNKYSKKRRKRKYNANAGILLVTLVVICFLGVVRVRMHSLQDVDHRYQVQQEALAKELAAEEKRTEELEESQAYVKTRQYVEDMARERLGLVRPNESIVKPN